MKINLTQKIDTLLAHIVLTCLTKTVLEELAEIGKTKEGIICDMKLTVNNHELDLQLFLEHWQSQIARMIKEKAKEIIKEKFRDMDEILYDLEERLKPEIEKRLEDWEKELP